ncbi:kynureninase [Trametopsis cervina]|nr:kynureninase [Trametopsis cervina]
MKESLSYKATIVLYKMQFRRWPSFGGPENKTNGADRTFRSEFVIPTNRQMKAISAPDALQDQECTYLCGNSLGLMAKRSKQLISEELDVWGTRAVEGHFDHPHGRDWMRIADHIHPHFADLVGADESEVACMGTLTANLHLMLHTFYKPTKERYKILCEEKAFPSDQYAFSSQVQVHGLNPSDTVIELAPRPGEFTLRTEDILSSITEHGSTIALVLFSGVQYYTGQWFAMQEITMAAQAQGSICGWDLAHAAGNVPLSLHDWNVDFAVWCTYKYLNSGPGNIAGLFVHNKWNSQPIRAAGWWGHDPATRFAMPSHFSAIPGAQGFQQSNPSVLATVSLLGSLQVFREAGGIKTLRLRSVRLTAYLEELLQRSKWWISPERVGQIQLQEERGEEHNEFGFTIITPTDPASRGSQLSLVFVPLGGRTMPKVQKLLGEFGVIGDSRKPDVIRLAPAALYNTEQDVERAVAVLEEVLDSLKNS